MIIQSSSGAVNSTYQAGSVIEKLGSWIKSDKNQNSNSDSYMLNKLSGKDKH
ncbi:hypothetical protein [Mucilaginibacter aquaedulcis]|uniref:hypothetical protein n=1 Tax=Mucilaginibacter aquaedulcis TaxID=1187081 RepID=UPI0025B37EC6|nr:hypothetical protein [Mucilaginibacter aquaedulcis]MDN3551577.1 hypothetical protein [Mucilaginibacter aquaedulcis]